MIDISFLAYQTESINYSNVFFDKNYNKWVNSGFFCFFMSIATISK